jgi:hypothetical protein
MYHFSPRVSIVLTLATALPLAAACQEQMRTTPVSMSTTSSPSNSTVSSNARLHDGLPDRLITAQVREGILTIDGMVAKVQLNYDIQRAGYLYFFVPGMGTAVVSRAPIADAERVANAFDGKTLTFVAGGHTFELSSKDSLLAKNKGKSTDVYVRVDRSAMAVGRYPRMGFGDVADSPYVWPLSAPAERDREAHVVPPPPLPTSVLPRTEVTASSSTPSKP